MAAATSEAPGRQVRLRRRLAALGRRTCFSSSIMVAHLAGGVRQVGTCLNSIARQITALAKAAVVGSTHPCGMPQPAARGSRVCGRARQTSRRCAHCQGEEMKLVASSSARQAASQALRNLHRARGQMGLRAGFKVCTHSVCCTAALSGQRAQRKGRQAHCPQANEEPRIQSKQVWRRWQRQRQRTCSAGGRCPPGSTAAGSSGSSSRCPRAGSPATLWRQVQRRRWPQKGMEPEDWHVSCTRHAEWRPPIGPPSCPGS